MDRGWFDRNSLDRNCVFFSVNQNFHNQLIEFFETFQLIKKFDQVPKFASYFLAVDQKKKAQNSIIRTFNQVPKFASYFLAVAQKFLN